MTARGLGSVAMGLAAAWALSCGRRAEPVAETTRETPKAAEHAGETPEGVLRIAPEMMRDLRVTLAKVETRSGGESVKLLGEVGVDESRYSEVGLAVAATVVSLRAAPGDPVRNGTPLAELESVELGSARAAYLSARARAEVARAALARKRELAGRVVPMREVEEAAAQARAAEAERDAAAAGLRALGIPDSEIAAGADSGGRLILRSPVAGVVIDRHAVLGQRTDPARPLFRVGDLSRLWLIVHAFERDAVRIHSGVEARVALPALPGRTLPGKVALVGRQVDSASRTIPVRIEIENTDGLLRPGMSASAMVPVGEAGKAIVAVPAASLQRLDEEWCVFVPTSESTFEVRRVGRGRDLGGEVEILSGLRAGETVVVDGAFLLKAQAEKASGEGEEHAH